ncbi:pentachlorophenol monooxygenase [Actinoplanes sp. ATCC 53533]|uniref:FAD-dependent monooxygenase n=1 Tax=Actinoplanes sp. ATCC 53533 TaxID=1288362 RepID=UPI000F77329A|nr:FAD-dependent monooxygenase [Actinoplanes sp. ATCC 53533]RSM69448.1 pentachlorophenol monooxygenase [Actinoplanes sp. ATCC 53533]
MPSPVVVLGNGPVGQTAALLLARWGASVVLLDQRPRRDPVGSKAIVQQRDVLDVWEAVGAGRRIAGQGLTWTVARTFHRDRELFNYTFADPGRSPFPPFVNISQTRTEEILDERIAAEPLIDVRWNHQVTGIAQDKQGVTVQCGARVLRASYVVACAGARGDDVRRMLGVSFDGRSFDDRFLICDIRTDLPGWANERRFYFDPPWNPGRQVLIHPCPDSTFRIDWQVPAGEDGAVGVDPAGRDTRIRAIIGDRPYELVWSSVYRFHSRVVDRMRVGRVLLAGDLAHLVSPFGARGLNSGVQDAENAAWKLAFILHGWADESLLDSYHDERHAAARENLDVTDATMRFLVPGTEAEHSHRRAVLAAAGTDPAARAAVNSGRLAEPFWYVDSPLTTPNPDHPFTGRPPRGAVPPAGPGILVPDAPVTIGGRRTRIRQLARDGFLLLAGDRVDAGTVHAAAQRATSAPIRLEHITDIDDDTALGARPDELWIIRPDAHVAAVLTGPDPAAVHTALRRAVAADTTTTEEEGHGALPATR